MSAQNLDEYGTVDDLMGMFSEVDEEPPANPFKVFVIFVASSVIGGLIIGGAFSIGAFALNS